MLLCLAYKVHGTSVLLMFTQHKQPNNAVNNYNEEREIQKISVLIIK